MPRLLLLTPAELSRDPRARRAAVTARRRGFDVVGLCGAATGEAPTAIDVPVARTGRPGRPDAAREVGLAERGAEPAPLRELRGLYRLARLGVRTARLWRAGRALAPPDVVHANDLETLPAAALLARRAGARLVYDAHELYSAFEADPPRLYNAAALALERALARRADAVVTVSEPLAEELHARLGLETAPLVVHNAPPLTQVAAPGAAGRPLEAVFQGSFGPGRPLGDLLDAVALAPDVRLTIRGVRVPAEAVRAEIARRGLEDRVVLAETVPPDAAVEALGGFHAGIVFDRPETRNNELSFPNKLFEYLMAGLAVVVPRLPGLAPLVEQERCGVTFEPGSPEALASALQALVARCNLEELRANARRLAVERFNAEAQEEALGRAWGA